MIRIFFIIACTCCHLLVIDTNCNIYCLGYCLFGMESSSEFTEIREGKAKIRVPSSSKVFYNPVQEFNRDLR